MSIMQEQIRMELEKNEIAADIWEDALSQLYVGMRYLDTALHILRRQPDSSFPGFGTDGESLQAGHGAGALPDRQCAGEPGVPACHDSLPVRTSVPGKGPAGTALAACVRRGGGVYHRSSARGMRASAGAGKAPGILSEA